MLSVTDAQKMILNEVKVIGVEKVLLTSALHRVLGEDTVAGLDHPPWDNSAMDGYAVRAQDVVGASRSTPVSLKVVQEIQAGQLSKYHLGSGEAISIMTGAPIPPGADAVVEMEETRLEGLPAGQTGTTVKIFREVGTGKNIRKRGENVRDGEKVLAQGSLLDAPEIGLLALLGKTSIPVYQQPGVAILATGDELADLGESLHEGQIYNSNSYALWGQIQEAGGVPRLLGIVRDKKEEFKERLKMGLSSDVVLISGAVSVGKYDFAREVMAELGVKIRFWTVAMRPGHPLVFGTHNSTLVFGLPGNPVSTMIAFEEFVRPVLSKMAGRRNIYPPVVEAVLMEPFRNHPGRTHFVRAIVEYLDGKYRVRPAGPQGSGILMSMVKANSLMILPADCEKVEAGATVKVQLLGSRWGWRDDPGYL